MLPVVVILQQCTVCHSGDVIRGRLETKLESHCQECEENFNLVVALHYH